MELGEILEIIHKNGYEHQVYRHLSEYILTDNAALRNDNAELEARLKAIEEVNNKGNNTISALCKRSKEV